MNLCWKNKLGVTLLLIGIILCGFSAKLFLAPAEFLAVAKACVFPELDREDFSSPLPEEGFPHGEFDRRAFNKIVRSIKSDFVLSNAISSLEKNDVQKIQVSGNSNINPREIRKHLNVGTDKYRDEWLVTVGYYGQTPEEAAVIANAIIKSYKDFRIYKREQAHRQQTKEAIRKLETFYQEEETLIKSMKQELSVKRQQLGIPAPEPAGDSLKIKFPTYCEAKEEFQKKVEEHKLLGDKIEWLKANPDSNWVVYGDVAIVYDKAIPPKEPDKSQRNIGISVLIAGLSFIILSAFLFRPPLALRRR